MTVKPIINAHLSAICLLSIATAANASCIAHPIGESERSLVTALLKRLSPLQVRGINLSAKDDGRDGYRLNGAMFSLFITPNTDNSLMDEVGFALSAPSTAGDTEKMMTAAAFTISRLSALSEPIVKARLYKNFDEHASGDWIEMFGPVAAILAKYDEGSVIKVKIATCSF